MHHGIQSAEKGVTQLSVGDAKVVGRRETVSFASPKLGRTAILVPGMHRSGTSALARVLNLLGCDISHSLLSANEFNERGYWEDPYFLDINDRMFQSAGLSWNSWESLNEDWYASPKPAQFVREAKALVEEKFGASSLFVIKDPRLARLIPFWRRVLEEMNISVKAVIPLRKPSEVAASIQRRDKINAHQAQLIWLRYNLDAEYHSRGLERAFLTYDQLLDDWRGAMGLVRESFSDFTWPRQSASAFSEIDAFLSADLRHHIEARKLAADESTWANDVWTILQRWAQDGAKRSDEKSLDAIRHVMGEAEGNFARLLIEYQKYGEAVANTLSETRAVLEAQVSDARVREEALAAALDAERALREQQQEAFGRQASADADALRAERALREQQQEAFERQMSADAKALYAVNAELADMGRDAIFEADETRRLSAQVVEQGQQIARLKAWLESAQKNSDHYKPGVDGVWDGSQPV